MSLKSRRAPMDRFRQRRGWKSLAVTRQPMSPALKDMIASSRAVTRAFPNHGYNRLELPQHALDEMRRWFRDRTREWMENEALRRIIEQAPDPFPPRLKGTPLGLSTLQVSIDFCRPLEEVERQSPTQPPE